MLAEVSWIRYRINVRDYNRYTHALNQTVNSAVWQYNADMMKTTIRVIHPKFESTISGVVGYEV